MVTRSAPYATQLREAIEARFRSIASCQAAIARIYGREAIGLRTIMRMLDRNREYRPRNSRPYLQLRRVLDLEVPRAQKDVDSQEGDSP